ncbi:SIS domain-containing protein [Thermopolyspora sp. NPDC052614]|uniref:SIS domain-containing protein n=1 Tax=Thermopolyspora sp. NPDC052614 TaxID=3155682 RepID=UPI0034288C8C
MPALDFDPDRLDDQAYLDNTDSTGMLRAVASSAARVRVAHRTAVESGVAALARDGRPRAIVVAGVGGSGIAGDMLAAICGYGAPLPIMTVRSHRLPGWVGAADLVMAVSPTGAGEETVAAAAEAVRRGCNLLAVGRAGSPLEAIARQAAGRFVPVTPQGGGPAATPWELAVPLMVAASALGLMRGEDDVYEAAALRLEDIAHRCRPASESFINPGKTLAMELADTVPMIWGTSPLAAVAASRFVGGLNENARYPAIHGEIPEAGHNQVAAFDGPLAAKDIFADGPGRTLRLFVLRDAEEDPRVARRREVSVRLAQDRGVPVSELRAEGAHPLERLATLVGLGDYGSVYLALGYGIDPAPMSAIGELEARVTQ